MNDKVVPKKASFFGSEDKKIDDNLYPVYFGASCALFAVRLLSLPRELGSERWSEARERMLRASAHLLGLLVWRVQRESEGAEARIERAEREVAELKRIRREDARANEKVVSIFAAQEQTWLVERRKLRQHVGTLISELRFQERQREQAASERERELAAEVEKREEAERRLREAEAAAEAAREAARREAEEHSSDLRRHKTAFIELVSSQRRLEAEMGRAARRAEAERRELEGSVATVQRMSAEVARMREDSEQKDKILSATLRKWRIDTAEKRMLMKEVKFSKARRKQAELETERWKERNSLRTMFAKHRAIPGDGDGDGDMGFDDDYSLSTTEDIDAKQVENWVRSEAERYTAVIEQRHRLEIDAFVEQMRLKDEKLEAFRWRLLSMELESKRLQSHVEGLNKELVQLRHNAIKTEAILSEKEKEQEEEEQEEESASSKEKFASQSPETSLTVQSPDKEFESLRSPGDSTDAAENLALTYQSQRSMNKANSSQWKMDLHALGVSYKLKRLKQQFVMLERLLGQQEESCTDTNNDNNNNKKPQSGTTKDFLSLMSFLNKQIGRYQSLQAKVDDLCKRMHESDLELSGGDFKIARTKEKTKILEHFLEETFQLQRYIVATGQKLVEVQAKIGSGFVGVEEELDKSTGFDLNRFSESVRSLFQDVQRGIEVRIARVIGDLEGTLACEGMIRLRRY